MKSQKNKFPLDPKVNWWRLPEEVAELAKKADSSETRPYKIYTATLMQSGGDSGGSINFNNPFPLIIGTSYTIMGNLPLNQGGTDFTNVGAPNNNIGTSFMAIDTTPVWGTEDGQLIFNEGAPVAKVLENTIGNIWWTYDSTGFYTGHSEELFTDNKSFALISSSTMGPIVTNISVYDSSNAMIVASAEDGYRENFIAYVEIRVYN